jgi:UDP-3-O-[3-hydroxymyristoyl] glucosamine N-acyltransferase
VHGNPKSNQYAGRKRQAGRCESEIIRGISKVVEKLQHALPHLVGRHSVVRRKIGIGEKLAIGPAVKLLEYGAGLNEKNTISRLCIIWGLP